MENITLQELYVEGFRGFKDGQVFRFDPSMTQFEGENGQGKTSIGEAIAWVMTGKSLSGAMKNLNVQNRDAERTMVHLKFTLNGVPHELERRISGGSAKVRLNGEGSSQKAIDQIFDTSAFLICLNPMIFLGMTETPARNLIVSLFDEVKKEDVLDQMTDEERDFLLKETFRVEQTNEYLKAQNRRKIELTQETTHLEGAMSQASFPVQIPPKPVLNNAALEAAQAEYEELLTKRPQPKGADSYDSHIKAIETEIREIRSRKFPKEVEKAELAKERKYLLTDYKRIDKEVFRPEPTDSLSAKRQVLVSSYEEAKREKVRLVNELNALAEAKCSCCGQVLPASQVKEKTESVEKKLKEAEANLSRSVKEGQEIAGKLKQLETDNEKNRKEFEAKKKAELEGIQKEGTEIARKLKALEVDEVEFARKADESINTLVQKRTEVEKAKADELGGMKDQIQKYETALKSARAKKDNLNAEYMTKQKELSQHEAAEQAEKKRRKTLADLEKAKVEIEKEQGAIADRIFYMKQFVLRKTSILRDAMRQHLNRVDLILEHVNEETGEVKNAFEVRFDGKPVHVCSLSEQIRTGMEITDMISALNGYQYPLFLDNAESITHYESNAHQVVEVKVVKGASLQTYSIPQSGPNLVRPKGA